MAIFKNTPPIVTSGLVMYLDAASSKSYTSGSLIWKDLTGTTLSGSIVNSLTSSLDGGGCIVLNGINSYINTNLQTTSSFTSNSSFTVSTWVKFNATQAVLSGLVCNQRYQSEGSPGGFGLVTQTGNIVSINLTKNDGTGILSYQTLAAIAVSTGSWLNVAYTYNSGSGTVTGYINGIQRNTTTSATYKWTSEARNTLIGTNTQGSWQNFSPYSIAQVTIHNRDLSTSEVKQNYDALKTRFNLS